MYQYGDIKDAKVGDVVRAVKGDKDVTKDKFYLIQKGTTNGSIGQFLDDSGAPSGGIYLSNTFWELVLTKPGKEAKVGDTIMFLDDRHYDYYAINKITKKGTTHVVTEVLSNGTVRYDLKIPDTNYNFGIQPRSCIVLQQEDAYLNNTSINVKSEIHSNQCVKTATPLLHQYWKDLYLNRADIMCKWVSSKNIPQKWYDLDSTTSTHKCRTFNSKLIEYKLKQTKSEETTMKNTIEIKVNGKDINLCKENKQQESVTELEAKLPFAMVVYAVNGGYEGIFYSKTEKGIKKNKNKFLQKPQNLGKTVTIHKCFGEFTTAVPVIEIK